MVCQCDYIITISTLRWCGVFVRIDFGSFPLGEHVMVLKGLMFVNFQFRRIWWILKGPILDYWLIWLSQTTTYTIANCCLPVSLSVSVDSYRSECLAYIGHWSTQLMQLVASSSLLVLTSLSSVYSTVHYVVDISELICCMYINIIPS